MKRENARLGCASANLTLDTEALWEAVHGAARAGPIGIAPRIVCRARRAQLARLGWPNLRL